MKTVFSIFRYDLRQLLHNPFAIIVIAGLILLPSVYAWYSVAAMWSPYSHTDGLKVAVVSEDEGVSVDEVKAEIEAAGIDPEALTGKLYGDELNVGALMVDAMREDKSFDWQFVGSAQGRSGLDSGEYYAEFVFPQQFTSDFLSVLSGDLERPTIEYWVNEKYNAVALEVTDAGAGVVDAVVNRVFSAVVANALSGVVKDVASHLLETGDEAKSVLSTGLDGAARDLRTVESGLERANSSIDKWSETVETAEKSLDALDSTLPDLEDALDEGQDLLSDARTSAHAVSSAYSTAFAQGGKELSKTLSDVAEVVSEAAEDIGEKQGDVDTALENAEDALDEFDRLIAALEKLNLKSSVPDDLEKQSKKLREEVASLKALSKKVSDAADKAVDATSPLSKDVDKAIKDMEGRSDSFNEEILPKIDTSLDAISIVMGSLSGALDNLEVQITQAKTLLDELDGVLQKTKDAVTSTAESLDDASGNIDSARSDLAALANSNAVKKVSSLAEIDPTSYASFMSSPVGSQIQQVYPLNSYGSGVAPFYTNLAIWVGCFMLIAILKLEVNPELFPRMRSWQGYVGRLLLFCLLALLQGAVVTIGDMVLGVQAISHVALVVAGLFTAFCFVNIVYALAITFKHVGKALAVVFLIVQIPGASGMYPIQLMPDFFQAMYPLLPFTYGMGAMREAIGGFYDGTYLQCLASLAACGLVALAVALIVRPWLLNLNRLFDRKLEDADVFIAEEHGLGSAAVAHPMADGLFEEGMGRAALNERLEVFTRRYIMLRQVAPLAILALLVCLCAVSLLFGLSIDGKLIALTALIAAIVVIFCACVAFEFSYDNLEARVGAAASPGGVVQPIAFAEVTWGAEDQEPSETPGAADEFEESEESDESDDPDDSSASAEADADDEADLGTAGEPDDPDEVDDPEEGADA